jgi:peptidoglycan pentaglycine glycine transferase (the first glycine)
VIALTPTPDDLARLTRDPTNWDDAVLANGGHMLQSWRWGEFKDAFGWQTERVAVPRQGGMALAQILFRHKAGVSIGYIPRGPVVPGDDSDAMQRLWEEIDRIARRRRALTIIAEPDQPIDSDLIQRVGLVSGAPPIQPSRTVKVALADDDALLNQMHQKTRYNVRLAQRRGVTSRLTPFSNEALGIFYDLLVDTASRNDFDIHSDAYYREFLRKFDNNSVLIFAEIEDRPVAGIVVAAFGDEAIYMYGASSTKDRAHGAGFLIQYEAMRWARDQGCRRYDLWGIPAQKPQSTKVDNGDRIAGTTGSDWRGLYEFKTRFGGQVIDYPEPLERRYHPILATLASRFYNAGGGT